MISITNQSVSGTRATADTRWAHHSAAPLPAGPSPLARARGERVSCTMLLAHHEKTDRPGDDRQREAGHHHDPARDIDGAKLEPMHRVPHQVPDPSTEMEEEGEGEKEEDDLPGYRKECSSHAGIGRRTESASRQPDNETHSSYSQEHAGDAVAYGQHRGDLRTVDLNIGRQRPLPDSGRRRSERGLRLPGLCRTVGRLGAGAGRGRGWIRMGCLTVREPGSRRVAQPIRRLALATAS